MIDEEGRGGKGGGVVEAKQETDGTNMNWNELICVMSRDRSSSR